MLQCLVKLAIGGSNRNLFSRKQPIFEPCIMHRQAECSQVDRSINLGTTSQILDASIVIAAINNHCVFPTATLVLGEHNSSAGEILL